MVVHFASAGVLFSRAAGGGVTVEDGGNFLVAIENQLGEVRAEPQVVYEAAMELLGDFVFFEPVFYLGVLGDKQGFLSVFVYFLFVDADALSRVEGGFFVINAKEDIVFSDNVEAEGWEVVVGVVPFCPEGFLVVVLAPCPCLGGVFAGGVGRELIDCSARFAEEYVVGGCCHILMEYPNPIILDNQGNGNVLVCVGNMIVNQHQVLLS